MRSEPRSVALATAMLVLAACRADAPQALGTLEWDRVTLPAPVAEKIVRVDVREGQQVAAGAPLLQLELTRTQSQLAAAQAQATQRREALAELRAGPRGEAIAQARASSHWAASAWSPPPRWIVRVPRRRVRRPRCGSHRRRCWN